MTAITEATKALVEQRDAWLNPPGTSGGAGETNADALYNARPTWLELATGLRYKRLDEAVLEAYGWPREVLARLLRLNGERASTG